MTSPSRPMQKFGLQTEKGKNILLFRNADHYQEEAVKVVVHSTKFRTYDQLKVELTKKVGLFTGAVNKVYGMDKKMIKNLEDFKDNHYYICCGAEKLNEEIIPKGLVGIFGVQEQSDSTSTTTTSTDESTATAPKPIKTPSTTTSTTTTSTSSSPSGITSSSPSSSSSPSPASITGRKPVVQAYTDKSSIPNKFSVGTEKARVITAYRNGDRVHGGERVTIHHTKFKTYDQLKEQLSKQVQLPTGSVRKVFTVDGKLVKNLEDFVDGQSYICAAGEGFNSEVMPNALVNHH